MNRPLTALVATMMLCIAAHADPTGFLPPEQSIEQALEELPDIAAARARVEEAQARGEALARGDYGFELTVMPLARHEMQGTTYAEVEAMVTRSFRLPRKRRIDRALGALGEEASTLALADVRHMAARLLLERWFDWLETAGKVALTERQWALTEDERKKVEKRLGTGDLAQLDLERAQAAEAQAAARTIEARQARERARAAMAETFPALGLPAAMPEIPDPVTDFAATTQMIQDIMQHSHEVAIARKLAERQSLAAARADANRLPDPSLGLRMLDEAQGEQKSLSLVVTIPFAAPSVDPTARAEQHLASAMTADAAAIERQVMTEARQLAESLPLLVQSWESARRARVVTEAALTRVSKAWTLGEAGFADLALARHQAYDTEAAELAARLALHKSALRVEIDTHRLWLAHKDLAQH